MTDLTGYLHEAHGDGVYWTLEAPSDLNVNLVHLDAGHVMAEHANDEVDVVIVVMAGSGVLTIDGDGIELTAQVVANVPRAARRSVRAADNQGLDYLSVHRRRGSLYVSPRPNRAELQPAQDEGGDPACWAHLFEDDTSEPAP